MTQYYKEDYINYRIQKSLETITEVEVLLQNKFWNTAVNRMYYACFYAVSAILIKNNVETASHSGTRQKFGELFVKTGKISRELGKHYSQLFEKRIKGDYNDFFDFDEKTTMSLFPHTKELIAQVQILLKD